MRSIFFSSKISIETLTVCTFHIKHFFNKYFYAWDLWGKNKLPPFCKDKTLLYRNIEYCVYKIKQTYMLMLMFVHAYVCSATSNW